MTSRNVYAGFKRKLVLAFDIGTTFSGISYSILDPGQVPKIQGVTRFPAQEQVSGSSKIPTVMYYDQSGNVRAVGAEAMSEGIYEQAEDEEWFKVEWFKLHLRPSKEKTSASGITSQLPPLPPNKSIVDVYSDFLRYLFTCAMKYIKETHPNGPDLWTTLAPDGDFVISHPNGWEGSQQAQLRGAAVGAGLIPNTPEAHERIQFVTEGEASLHYSIENGLPANSLRQGDGVAIVDAGGGTIDISAYAQSVPAPGSTLTTRIFEEIAPPQCHFNGSVFISLHARVYLEELLKESDFLDDLDSIVRCFDKTTKLRFRNVNDPQFVKFGSTRDNEPETGIRYGQLKLSGTHVARFFEPSVNCVVEAVIEQRRLAHKPFTHVVLVGGFASSDWLYDRVSEALSPHGFNVIRPENHLNKAVADGAMSFYIDHCVRTRVSKFTFGQFSNTRFNPTDPEHVKRMKDVYTSLSGHKNIKNNFSVILPKNSQVSETKEFAKDFHISRKSMDKLAKATVHVWCYRGKIATPQWKDVDRENYSRLCTIVVDLAHLASCAEQFKKEGPDGPFYRLHYRLILMFGLSELKAVFSWKENGVEKRSPANIIYEPEG